LRTRKIQTVLSSRIEGELVVLCEGGLQVGGSGNNNKEKVSREPGQKWERAPDVVRREVLI